MISYAKILPFAQAVKIADGPELGFAAADAQLVGVDLRPCALRGEDCPQVETLVEVEVVAVGVFLDNRLEDMCAAQHCRTSVGGDIEAEDRGVGIVERILRFGLGGRPPGET